MFAFDPAFQVSVYSHPDIWLVKVVSDERIKIDIFSSVHKIEICLWIFSECLSKMIQPFIFKIGLHVDPRWIVVGVFINVILFSALHTFLIFPLPGTKDVKGQNYNILNT